MSTTHILLAWPSSVTVVDVTPRDGLQDADRLVSLDDKLSFIDALAAAGVSCIEVTAFMRSEWVPQLADADDLAAQLPKRDGILYSALVPNMRGYERVRRAGIRAVTLVISASEAHNRANLNRSVAASLGQLAAVVAQARSDGVSVRGSVATAFGCPFEGAVAPTAVLRIVREYVAMGVDQLSLADTIGAANPRQVYDLFARVREEARDIPLSAHFHDNKGHGLANVFAALQAGVTVFDAALGGLGGCPYAPGAPGNLSTEALVDYLEVMGLRTGIVLERLAAARAQVLAALARGVPASTGHSMR
jgi:hydroxymethylglutaryl-CoA lyase